MPTAPMPLPPCPPRCRNSTAHGTPTPGVPLPRCHFVGPGNGTAGTAYVLDVLHPDGTVEFCASPRVRPLPDSDTNGVVDLDVLVERGLAWSA